jgi:hypothetical protein
MNVILAVAAVAGLVLAAGAYLLFVHHPGGTTMWARFLTWLRSLLRRVFRGTGDEPPSRFPAARPRPAPVRPSVGPAPGDGGGLAPLPLDVGPGEIPPVFVPALAFVRDFEPEDDTHLMGLGRGLAAFELAFAEAIDTALQNCLAPGIRLDPMSVAGMGDYADLRADSAHMAMDIWRRFVTVYDEIKAFRAAGGVLPRDGDFLTDEA